MNFKDMLLPVGLALITTWVIQNYLLNRDSSPSTNGQDTTFVAPAVTQAAARPLVKEIDFIDSKRSVQTKISPVTTSWGYLEFSSEGASLERVEFNRKIDGKDSRLSLAFPTDDTTRERKFFLVGLDEKTPYFYELIDQKEDEKTVRLMYQSVDSKPVIRKTFTIFKDAHQIDLDLEVDQMPIVEGGAGIRILYPSPLLPELQDQEQVSAVVFDAKNSFEKIAKSSVKPDQGWVSPTMFGADNKYYIFTMVKDPSSFAQRAYYKHVANEYLFSILEGSTIQPKANWHLSFYLGPKEAGAFDAVEPGLEKALDYYGWFAPISRYLLQVLNWLYEYLHSYGLAIILLTLLIKLLLFPFTIQSERGMKDRMEMQKKLAYLQQRYKDDPERLQLERTELIRKHGTGLGGCLPMLLQIPIFFALSRVLANSIELYKAPMLWIPDLSARDPYYVLPILVMLGMLAQSTTTTDPKQRMPMVAMAFAFAAITASLSSGLALYICMSTLLGVAQSKLVRFFKLVR